MFRFFSCLIFIIGLWCVSNAALADTADCLRRFPAIYATHAKSWCAKYEKCQNNKGSREQMRCCIDVFKSVESDLVWISSLCKVSPQMSSCKNYPPKILQQVDQANNEARNECWFGND